MSNKECIALILAGGQGSRLAALTTQIPKPAIPFGGKYRLIDFSLSNCINSGINTIGVLTAKKALEIENVIGSGTSIEPAKTHSIIQTLPPRNGLSSYTGTANAVFANIEFIEKFSPEYVLVLSGDHVYNMDYSLFIRHHKENRADLSIAVMEVSWSEASRFGIMATNPDGSIADFTEKPIQPKSNLASMGIYVFSWPKLKRYLEWDEANLLSAHDFGKNIIPAMLGQGERLYAYPFNGYWKDVGTVESFYQAHMDLLSEPPGFDIDDARWPIHSTLAGVAPNLVSFERQKKLIIGGRGFLRGEIEGSVIFPGTYIGARAKVRNSIIMPGARVENGARVEQAIIGPGAVVESGCAVIGGGKYPIAVVAQNGIVSSARVGFGA
ncbi:MAG: sugar phosphate nucleotidyltransferase [Negativicutes bacterium]|nr:sugar phosphate nucleotidyltransferase [Negativicutes bacterium]